MIFFTCATDLRSMLLRRELDKLKGVLLILFYQRPGIMDILSASIQMLLDQRDGKKVHFTKKTSFMYFVSLKACLFRETTL